MLYYLPNARLETQRQEMIALEEAGICIFCPEAYTYSEREVLLRYDGGVSYKKHVLDENATWVQLLNEYPYPNTIQHVMLVPRRHVTRLDELSDEEWADYPDILRRVTDRLGVHYSKFSRNGVMSATGATIAHVHEQFTVQDPDAAGPVVAYIGKPSNPSDAPPSP